MNILLLTSHSIAEYDDLRMLTDLGYDVFSIGAYTDPRNPGDDKRPALDVPAHPELAALCDVQREKHAGEDASRAIDWAKADLHPDIVDWADVLIIHHFPEMWIAGQWDAIKRKRVIWRTCGQSDPRLETIMAPLYDDGLQIVRYSPAERRAFQTNGTWAGEDAMIRFGKYPDDYGPWRGDDIVVGNVTQHMKQRGDSCGYSTWDILTHGLSVKPAGPGSEDLRCGIGPLDYYAMLDYLAGLRTYLYTGTQPASYTLGLMEAMLSGIPVVTKRWDVESIWLRDLWESSELVGDVGLYAQRETLKMFLTHWDIAQRMGAEVRIRAVNMFGVETVGQYWRSFLEGADMGFTFEPAA